MSSPPRPRSPSPPPRGRGRGRGQSSPPLARHDRPTRLLGVRGRGRSLPRTRLDLSLAFSALRGGGIGHRAPSTPATASPATGTPATATPPSALVSGSTASSVCSPPVYYGPAVPDDLLQARMLLGSLPPWFPPRCPSVGVKMWSPVEFKADENDNGSESQGTSNRGLSLFEKVKMWSPVEFKADENDNGSESQGTSNRGLSLFEKEDLKQSSDVSSLLHISSDDNLSSTLRTASLYRGVSVFEDEEFKSEADLFSYHTAHSGKKLNFLGKEFAFEELSSATNGFKDRISHYDEPVFTGTHAKLGPIAVCMTLKSGDELKLYLDGMMKCVCRKQRVHPNLAYPVGYCSTKEEFYVVYDFNYQNNLSEIIQKDEIGNSHKFKIALDVARGLKHIVNGDSALNLPRVKSEMIWLTSDGRAVIADFFGSNTSDQTSLAREFAMLLKELIPILDNADERFIVYNHLIEHCSNADLEHVPCFDIIVQHLESIAGALEGHP